MSAITSTLRPNSYREDVARTGSDIGPRHGAFSSPSHVNKCVNAYRGDGVGTRHSEASAASLSGPEWRLKATRGVWLKRKCVIILNLILHFLKRLKSIHHYMTSIAQIIGGTFYKNFGNGPDTCSILSSHRSHTKANAIYLADGRKCSDTHHRAGKPREQAGCSVR
jgi:hypothetical protein